MWISQILLPIALLSLCALIGCCSWLLLSARGSAKKIGRSYESSVPGRLDQVESTLKSLRLEWLDTYEKLSKLAGRLDRYRGIEKLNSSLDSSLSSKTGTPAENGGTLESRNEVLKRWHSRGRAF